MSETLETLTASINRAAAERLEAYRKQIEGLPVPVRIKPGDNLSVYKGIGEMAYKKVAGNRHYALSDDAKLQFGALVVAAHQHSIEHGKPLAANVVPQILEMLSGIEDFEKVAALRQRRPGPEEPLPQLPVDPITGQPVKNPWLGKTMEDFASRDAIQKQSPKLASWLEECAKHGGPTAGMLQRLEDQRARDKRLREMPYGEAEWNNNLLRKELAATATEQNKWGKSLDPDLLAFHQIEKDLGSPSLAFDNFTCENLAYQLGPNIGQIYSAGKKLHKEWVAEREAKKQKAA